jgi:hypothetical protein
MARFPLYHFSRVCDLVLAVKMPWLKWLLQLPIRYFVFVPLAALR